MLSMLYSCALQAEKLAMDKALEQQDHMKKVQLQEDQSSSLVQQLADVKLEVVKAACKRDKVGAENLKHFSPSTL